MDGKETREQIGITNKDRGIKKEVTEPMHYQKYIYLCQVNKKSEYHYNYPKPNETHK